MDPPPEIDRALAAAAPDDDDERVPQSSLMQKPRLMMQEADGEPSLLPPGDDHHHHDVEDDTVVAPSSGARDEAGAAEMQEPLLVAAGDATSRIPPPPPPIERVGSVTGQLPPATGAEETEADGQPQPQPPGVTASETPAPPEPTRQEPQQQAGDGDAAKEDASARDEDGGKKKPSASSRWRMRVRSLMHLRKGSPPPPESGDLAGVGAGDAPTKQGKEEEAGSKLSSDEAKPPPPPPPPPKIKSMMRTESRLSGVGAGAGAGAGDAHTKPTKEEGEGEGSKSGRDEDKPPCLHKIKSMMRTLSRLSGAGGEDGDGGTPASTPAAKPKPSPAPEEDGDHRSTLFKRLQAVFRAVHFMTRLRRNKKGGEPGRDQEKDGKGKEEDQSPAPGKTEEKTPESPSPAQPDQEEKEKKKEEGKLKRRWKKREEAHLQTILEDAFTNLLAREFDTLKDQWRQCLLTFAVFPVDHQVKKQAVTYWWAAQFGLKHDAEKIFDKLCRSGFLEPNTNRCSGVSHGCCVNPLVHWMVKRKARESVLADLDAHGEPADKQPKSYLLCLTASYRERLQMIARSDEAPAPKKKKKNSKESPQENKAHPARTRSKEGPHQSSGQDKEQQNENDDKTKLELREFDNKRVILNINAHVYRLPNRLVTHLGGNLIVLQLGRWWNSDDNTYMEVEGLQKLSAISNLKNLRYLGIRGLSKLTELPNEVSKLQQLEVLDVRGCQNLTRVTSSNVKNLRLLTHLDLTECYMLEHIGREITSLSKLQVFKGFVFSVDSRWSNVCRLQDIGAKMKNLQKLSINVTTDANVAEKEMAQLKHLSDLKSLTITWGELPSILISKKRDEGRKQLLKRWTSLELPPSLVKLDIRCYPDKVIPCKWFEQGSNKSKMLEKLYVRGGVVEELDLPDDNNIKTLRLRYLKEFNMKWGDMLSMMKKLRYVEVFIKDAKVMKSEKRKYQVENVKLEPHMVKEDKKMTKYEEIKLMEMIKKLGIPKSKLDDEGVWVWDEKEVDQNKNEEVDHKEKVPGATESTQAPSHVLQNEVLQTEDTRNNDVEDVSTISNMMGKEQTKGAQTPSGGTSKISNIVEKSHNDGVQTPTTELPKWDTSESGVVAAHDTLSAPRVSI